MSRQIVWGHLIGEIAAISKLGYARGIDVETQDVEAGTGESGCDRKANIPQPYDRQTILCDDAAVIGHVGSSHL